MAKKFVSAPALLLALAASTAVAGPDAGDRSFTLSGTGSSDQDFDTTTLGATGELGWFTTDRWEVGVRQSVNVLALDDAEDVWAGSTRGFADFHFGSDAWRPYVGANLGGLYGEQVNETFSAGFETGIKYYVKDKTFVELQAEYQFLFDEADQIDNQFDDGAIFYTLGVGFNF